MPENGKVSLATDRRARKHYIIHQVYGTSCVPCCIAMVKYYWNTQGVCSKSSAEEEAIAASPWKEYEGMSLGDAPGVINKMVPGIESVHMRPGVKALFDTLQLWVTPTNPAIVELDHSWQAMGHVALCRYVDGDGFGFFLDPGKGLVEAHKSKAPFFRFNETGKFLYGGALVVSKPRKKS